MALKCFDYECEHCKIFFERFFDSHYAEEKFAVCPCCNRDCPRVFIYGSKIDRTAACAWNGIGDEKTGYFHDKKTYHDAIYSQGRLINEPGMDKDAQRNHEYYVEKMFNEVYEKVDKKVQDHTLDELRAQIAVDKQIQDATDRGDENAIKRMGGLTSLDEAYERANS